MKTRKNCAEIAQAMTYGAIDGPSTPRCSICGNCRLKKMLLKEDQGILTRFGDTKAIDEPSSP